MTTPHRGVRIKWGETRGVSWTVLGFWPLLPLHQLPQVVSGCAVGA